MVGIIKDEVEAQLKIKHSPDQISKSLALRDLKVSHETIYRYLADAKKAGGEDPEPRGRKVRSITNENGLDGLLVARAFRRSDGRGVHD